MKATENPRGKFERTDPASPARILVVDDNVDAADSLGMLLRSWGYDAAVASDGASALTTAATFAPHAVILDIGMPQMNGYDVARTLRQSAGGDQVLLIALTAWAGDGNKQRATEAGFHEHFTKPADLESLKRFLAEALPGVAATDASAPSERREAIDLPGF